MGFSFPALWWGGPGTDLRAPTFSIIALLQAHQLSPQMASLLWSLLARRASLLVVGGHLRGVGKTTTTSALTAFFPADTELVFTQGPREDFAFLQRTAPERTYIMVNEFSDHTPQYLWGEKAARVFDLTKLGYAFAGTIHAESIEEVLSELGSPPVRLSPSSIAESLQLVVMQAAFQTPEGVTRRVTSLYWLQPAERGPDGLGIKSLAAWDAQQDQWHLFSSPETWADLARWAKVEPAELQEEVDQRRRCLERLMASPAPDFARVREELLDCVPQGALL